MTWKKWAVAVVCLSAVAVLGQTGRSDPAAENAARMLTEGKQTFRFATFGDEAFWGGTLKLHQAIQTVSPKTALAVGLKVDAEALPSELVTAVRAGRVSL